MTGFEVFERRFARAASTPTLTITTRGTLNLNGPAFSELGKPDAVVLLYAREDAIIGLRPCGQDEPNAYRVGPLGREGTSRTVVAKDFCAWIGADLSNARRYPLAVRDGVGYVDTHEQAKIVTGNRNRAGRRRQVTK